MSGVSNVRNVIEQLWINSNPKRTITADNVLQKLRKNFNYNYPIKIKKSYNQIMVAENKKLLKYSFDFFSILYNGILSYIKTYISWLLREKYPSC